jgi:hypothetical protein
MKDKRQFILDALLPYKNNPGLCAINESGACLYLADNGNKCAIGQFMLDKKHQKVCGSIQDVLETFNEEEIFSQEFLEQNLRICEMELMQKYHDFVALSYTIRQINNLVGGLEKTTNLSFPELYFDILD